MKESKNLCVALTTGYYFLLSIETSETLCYESALKQAVIIALKNDLQFTHIKDNDINDWIKEQKKYNKKELKNMSDDEIIEYYNFLYIDLSDTFDFNIYIDMSNTRIDHLIYDNTYLLSDETLKR